MTAVHLPLITVSEAKCFHRCQREHFISYRLGVRPIHRADPLRFGSGFHGGLEAWWDAARRGLSREEWLAAALAALAKHLDDPFEVVRAEEMILGYHARWVAQELEVLGVEVEFAMPLVNPATSSPSKTFRVGGKIDALVRTKAGTTYVVEHKCLAGDSRVFDHETGRYWTLRELHEANRGPLVTGLAASGELRVARAKPPIPQPERATVVIETATGRRIVASDNHPFWTTRGWVAAGELSSADYVGIPRHAPSDASGVDAPDEAIRLLGYMIGDGCLSRMSFTKTSERVLADVVHCAGALGEVPRRHDDPKRTTSLQFSRVGPVARWLTAAGLHGLAKDKRVPPALPLSDLQVGQLVGALWSTDGCIDTFEERKPRLIYTSVSEALCRDIQALLQRLGMVSSVRSTSVAYKGERRGVFTVQVITRASKRRFVGLAREGVIPITRSAVDLDALERAIPTDNGPASDEARQPVVSDVLHWDRVAGMNTGPSETLYDIEVPGIHTFVAEGIVTHNTSSEDIGAGGDYWRRLRLDAQVSTYFVGARSLGHDVAGCLYDVIGKVQLRPYEPTPIESRKYKKDGTLYANQRDQPETIDEYRARVREHIATNPDRYFVRGVVARTEEDERDAAFDLWQTARAVADAERMQRFPRNDQACVRYGRTCDYFPVCTREASLEDETKFRKSKKAHEELGGMESAA